MSSKEFELALRAHLHSKFLNQLPPQLLKMRVGDFLQLAAVGHDKENASNYLVETPKTATRRSVRQGAASTLASITKSVKKSLFSLTTPSKQPSTRSTHSLSTPSVAPPQTPHLTIKSSVVKAQGPVSHTPSKRYKQLPSTSYTTTTTAQTPKAQTVHRADSPATSTGIVQFQLQDGQVIDVDFSRSPKSALAEANLIGSEAIGEVKAKIETYANQFMQYLKFFKKFKPN